MRDACLFLLQEPRTQGSHLQAMPALCLRVGRLPWLTVPENKEATDAKAKPENV